MGLSSIVGNIITSSISSYCTYKSATAQNELTKTQKEILEEEHNYTKSQRTKKEIAYDKYLFDREEDRNIDKLGKLIKLLTHLKKSNICPETEAVVKYKIKQVTERLKNNKQNNFQAKNKQIVNKTNTKNTNKNNSMQPMIF